MTRPSARSRFLRGVTLPLLILTLSLAPAPAVAQILITEIMFDPVSDRGCEYVELFNPQPEPVALRNWRLVDATGATQATLPRAATITAGGYLAIAADSLLFAQFPSLRDSSTVLVVGRASLGLNATGDEVVLRDADGTTIDSVPYDPDWHRPDLDDRSGTSLERASTSAASSDPRAWSSSVARGGGTPGAPNAIAIEPSVADALLSVDPPTVSPDADGVQDLTRISFRLPMRTARIMLTLHDRAGRLLDRIVNNEVSAPTGEVIWRAYSPAGLPLPPDVYVLRIEAYDPVRIALVTARTGIVVARR